MPDTKQPETTANEPSQSQELQETSSTQAEETKQATAIEEELKSVQNQLLYLRADFDNYKKRMLREQEQSIRFANERIIRDLLLIEDHLLRAISHASSLKSRKDNEVTNFITGVELTRQELLQLFTKYGLEFFGAVGERFDPARHEAVSQKEAPAGQAEHLLEVIQKGALLNGRLLKPAKVIVGKAVEDKESAPKA